MKEKDLGTRVEESAMDRRVFLKGAALTGAAALSAGALAACSPSASGSSPSASETDGTTTAAVTEPVGGAICPEDWLGEPPVIDDADIAETVDYDVVILGGGHAGSQAACAAAQAGAKVAVVEIQAEDTFSSFGDDICSYNSEFVKSKGYGPYDTGEIVMEYVKRGNGRVDSEVIRSFVENSGEMLDNLVACTPDTSNLFDYEGGQCIIQHAFGKESGADYPISINGYKAWASTVQTIGTTNPTPVDGREGISRMTEVDTYMRLEAERLGAQWYWKHEATVLVQDADGAVTGAIAKASDDTYVKLNASKGVLLATGDFSADADMVYNLLDEVAEWGARIGEDRQDMAGMGRNGVGHKLGCWVGGGMEPHPRPTMDGGNAGAWGTTPFLHLNANGERFTNEAIAQLLGASIRQQPAGLIAVITDAKYMDVIKSVGVDHGAPNWGKPEYVLEMEPAMEAIVPGPEGGAVPNIEIINIKNHEEGEEGGTVFKADTLEELLDYVGYTGEAKTNALESIKRYNEFCANSQDGDYNKDAQFMVAIDTPPFYASAGEAKWKTRAGLVCLAGLYCDKNLNVLKADRSGTIKGLYAAGNCVGMRYGNGYSTPSAGNSMGMAMTHGRVAGKTIAAL